MRGPTQRVSEIVPDIPPALDNAIWRALARDPRRRYPTARAFADALVDAFGAVDHSWVAAWMRERAGTLLQERQSIVRHLLVIEREDNVETITTVSQPPPVDVTSAPMMIEPPRVREAPPGKSRNWQMGLLGFAAAAITVAVLMVATAKPDPTPPPAPLSQPEPAATTPPAPAPEPAPSMAPSAKIVVAPAPAPAAPPAPVKPRTTKKTEKDPKADCNPPYTEDETGKHFKPWCLRP